MLRSNLCYYRDVYIPVKGTITAAELWNCAPLTSCISRINNTQIDDAQYIDVVMPMYNLIEHSDSFSKICGNLWQYCRDVPAVDNDGAINYWFYWS